MNDELRAELRFLIDQVRGEVERERLHGSVEMVVPVELPARVDPPARGREIVTSDEPIAPAVLTNSTSSNEPITPEAQPQPPAPRKLSVSSPRRATPPAPAFAAPVTAEQEKVAAKRLPPVELPKDERRDMARLAKELAAFGKEASACRNCGLCETRTRVVYGSGTARHPLLFVGEAPGFNEDQQGLPFVGQAGKLLTDIIAAMGFDREDVYIANLLKCRPPGNRDPLPHEIEACFPWLKRQIELIEPRAICTLGKHSALTLTGKPPKATIGTLRGKVFDYNGIPVVPTYHPAFLLRSPSYKRATWEDVQLVRELYLADGARDTRGV